MSGAANVALGASSLDNRRRWRIWIALVTLVLAGAALRVAVNNVTTYSPFDETAYLRYTVMAWGKGFIEGYRALNEFVIANPVYWSSPLPSRWLYFLVTSSLCGLTSCDYRMLAWISTASGVAAIPLAWLVARRLFDERIALVASAFVATSPLQLAMGRRALQDEPFAAVVLLALWAFLRVLDLGPHQRGIGLYSLAVISATAAFGVKEAFLFYYIGFVGLVATQFWTRRRIADVLLIVLPPALYAAIYVLLVHDVSALFTMLRISRQASGSVVVQQQLSGPPQQVILDFLLLAPMVTLVVIAAISAVVAGWGRAPRGARGLTLFTLIVLGILAITPKDIRYSIGLDTPFRALAAWAIASQWPLVAARPWLLVSLVGFNAAIELVIFWAVFLVGGVYDPVIVNLLRALDAIPR